MNLQLREVDVSQGDRTPDFSDVGRTVRGLLGRDIQETKLARQPGPQGTIAVSHGPVFFIGGITAEALPSLIEKLNGTKK